jgi:glutamyl-tRNA synthetase
MIRVRFAARPTGLLLVGGARVALANYLFARGHDGQFLLRLDDLDGGCPSLTHATQIMQDLRWLGIDWDLSIRQSERHHVYQDAIIRLKQQGLLYPCFESEQELKAKQEFRRKRNQPQVYDRAMLSLTERQRQAAETGGKRPYWRMRLSGRTLAWQDLVLGERRTDLSRVSDPILVRADGTAAPILASVVDDIAFETTHIIRDEAHGAGTAIQIELFETLTAIPGCIRFAHLPALEPPPPASEAGLAAPDTTDRPAATRRAGNQSIRALRNDGVEPCAIAATMAGIPSEQGYPPPLAELARQFKLSGLAGFGFDATRMLAVNRRVLSSMAFAAVADRLPGGSTETFWLAVRGSLDLLREARGWWDVVAGTIIPPVMEGEQELLTTAEALLPPEPWDSSVWEGWIAALEQTTGRIGHALLQPLRLALTGEDTGPDLADLLPLIGRPRAAARLRIAAA